MPLWYNMDMEEQPRVALNLRLSPDLRDALRRVARQNGRSVTAEIVRRLEQSLRDDERRERRRLTRPSGACP